MGYTTGGLSSSTHLHGVTLVSYLSDCSNRTMALGGFSLQQKYQDDSESVRHRTADS
jgi:hypothetical protein